MSAEVSAKFYLSPQQITALGDALDIDFTNVESFYVEGFLGVLVAHIQTVRDIPAERFFKAMGSIK